MGTVLVVVVVFAATAAVLGFGTKVCVAAKVVFMMVSWRISVAGTAVLSLF